MTPQQELLLEIEAYIEQRGIRESTFGRLAVNDGKFVRRLRDQKNVGVNIIARVREYMRRNAPVPREAAE